MNFHYIQKHTDVERQKSLHIMELTTFKLSFSKPFESLIQFLLTKMSWKIKKYVFTKTFKQKR